MLSLLAVLVFTDVFAEARPLLCLQVAKVFASLRAIPLVLAMSVIERLAKADVTGASGSDLGMATFGS